MGGAAAVRVAVARLVAIDADYANAWFDLFGGGGHATDQRSKPGGGDQQVQLRSKLEHLERHGGAPGDETRALRALNAGHALLVGTFERDALGIGERLAVDDLDLCAPVLEGAHEVRRGRVRIQVDQRRYLEDVTRVGGGGSMHESIADQTSCELPRRERERRIEHAAYGEAFGDLEVLELEVDLHARPVGAGEPGLHERRVAQEGHDPLVRALDLVELDGNRVV